MAYGKCGRNTSRNISNYPFTIYLRLLAKVLQDGKETQNGSIKYKTNFWHSEERHK
jgi:hypothetical protein